MCGYVFACSASTPSPFPPIFSLKTQQTTQYSLTCLQTATLFFLNTLCRADQRRRFQEWIFVCVCVCVCMCDVCLQKVCRSSRGIICVCSYVHSSCVCGSDQMFLDAFGSFGIYKQTMHNSLRIYSLHVQCLKFGTRCIYVYIYIYVFGGLLKPNRCPFLSLL